MAGVFLSDEDFKKGLKGFPMACFDVIAEQEGKVLILYRTIEPYKNVWALSGLRKRKGETTKAVLERVVKDELGLKLDLNPESMPIVGQFDGFFTEERDGVDRHDSSTAYFLKLDAGQEIKFNDKHFSDMRWIASEKEIPEKTGEMYSYYLRRYFSQIKK